VEVIIDIDGGSRATRIQRGRRVGEFQILEKPRTIGPPLDTKLSNPASFDPVGQASVALSARWYPMVLTTRSGTVDRKSGDRLSTGQTNRAQHTLSNRKEAAPRRAEALRPRPTEEILLRAVAPAAIVISKAGRTVARRGPRRPR
jgi:hypothetical protein